MANPRGGGRGESRGPPGGQRRCRRAAPARLAARTCVQPPRHPPPRPAHSSGARAQPLEERELTAPKEDECGCLLDEIKRHYRRAPRWPWGQGECWCPRGCGRPRGGRGRCLLRAMPVVPRARRHLHCQSAAWRLLPRPIATHALSPLAPLPNAEAARPPPLLPPHPTPPRPRTHTGAPLR